MKKSLFLCSILQGDQCAGQGDDAVEEEHGRGDAVDAEVQRDAVLEDADVIEPGPALGEAELLVGGLVIDEHVEGEREEDGADRDRERADDVFALRRHDDEHRRRDHR